MTTLEELERRVARLETSLELRKAVEANGVALMNLLAEMRQTGVALASVTAKLDAVEEEMGGRFDVLDRHLDQIDVTLATILARLPEPPS